MTTVKAVAAQKRPPQVIADQVPKYNSRDLTEEERALPIDERRKIESRNYALWLGDLFSFTNGVSGVLTYRAGYYHPKIEFIVDGKTLAAYPGDYVLTHDDGHKTVLSEDNFLREYDILPEE